MGTPCGLKTVTAGTSATNLHFLLRPTCTPYYETMFKIMPAFPSVNPCTPFVATYFATAILIAIDHLFAHALSRDGALFIVNIYCKNARQTMYHPAPDASASTSDQTDHHS
jgi:hypothetical protein